MSHLSCSRSGEGASCRPRSAHLLIFGLAAFVASQFALAGPADANPLKALFSIFEKKEKPKPAPVIISPKSSKGKLQRGQRVLNPFFGTGRNGQKQSQSAKPNSFNMGRRTMCVRLCDGYYWPMKRGGSNNSLMTDSQKCESQCASPAKLFVLRSSTDNIAGMRDLGGKPYRRLKNAFAYRKTYNPSCRCKADPWSERARLRHKRYAAVGKERRILALRAISLDLRSTIKPKKDPAVSAAEKALPATRTLVPVLPVRKPVTDAAIVVTSIMRQGGLVELSASDDTAPAVTRAESGSDGSLEKAQSRVGKAASQVRVFNLGDLDKVSTNSSRIPRAPVQSRIKQSSLLRSSVLPIRLQLRSRYNYVRPCPRVRSKAGPRSGPWPLPA